MRTVSWLAVGVVVGLACAPRVEVRPEVLDARGMSASMAQAQAQAAQVQCRGAVAPLGDDVREPCALVCTSERLLPPPAEGGFDGPHRTTLRINDAGMVLEVAHFEDGGFSCARVTE